MRPNHQVMRFQIQAALSNAARMMTWPLLTSGSGDSA